MIAPGVLAQQALLAGGGSSKTRPVFRASSSAGAESGTLSVPLPTGWQVGDLAILHIGSSSGSAIAVSGWTEFASRPATGGNQRTYYRVLQSGDGPASVPSVGKRAAVMMAFQVGTFDPTLLVEGMLGASASGTGTSVSAPDSEDIAADPYYRIQVALTIRNTFYTDTTTYPYAALQLSRITGGSFPFPVIYLSGGEFDGGIDAGSSFVRPVSENWATYKILIHPAP